MIKFTLCYKRKGSNAYVYRYTQSTDIDQAIKDAPKSIRNIARTKEHTYYLHCVIGGGRSVFRKDLDEKETALQLLREAVDTLNNSGSISSKNKADEIESFLRWYG